MLHLPNEAIEGDQVGPRAAFKAMLADRTIMDYAPFSFLIEARKRGGAEGAIKRLLDLADGFLPTVVFWQHVGRFPVTHEALRRLQELESRPTIVYHEGDVYWRFRTRPTRSMRILTAHAHIAFVVGLGQNARQFRRMGAKRVIYSPSAADEIRFGTPWDPDKANRAGVVIIANRGTSAIKGLSIPGEAYREKLVMALHRRLGRQLVVYGRGWEDFPFAAGPLPFSEQENIMRRHLLSASWSHFNAPFYFSNRLPIALLSGVAHATNYQPGYELMFRNGEELVYYHSIDEAVDWIDWLLSRPKSRLIDIGLAGQKLARERLTSEVVFRNMIAHIRRARAEESVRS